MSGEWPPAGTTPLPIDVVSVQSQVVYGRVGNNLAVPTLARLGLHVAAVPTVLLSNTPHYPSLHGGVLPVDWFEGWLDDLTARGGLGGLRAVLCGYLGSTDQARVLARWIRQRLRATPKLKVIVDPVIGDADHGVYVDPGLIDAYRRELLPLADGLTPNAFELAHLTERDTGDMPDTIAAARMLLTGRTRWVVVTSAAPRTWQRGDMRLAWMTRAAAHSLSHPRIDSAAKGTGDLFAATLTGNRVCGCSLRNAVDRAYRQVVAALRVTRAAHCAELLLPGAASADPGKLVSGP